MDDPREERGRSLPKEEEELEEEDWEEEEEDEEWEEEDEEFEEEEEEEEPPAKPAKAAKPAAKAEEKKPAQEDKTAKADKDAKKPSAEKKKEPPKKDDAPKEPGDPMKLPRTLFVLGLVVFFLSTCAEKSYIPAVMKQKSLVDYYGGATRKPIPPSEPYRKRSALLDNDAKQKENDEFRKAWEEASEKWEKSEERQAFEQESADHAEWIALHREDAAYAGRTAEQIQYSMGAWSRFYFYIGQIGVLLMLIGLSLILLKAELWERIAALAVLGFAIIPLLKEFGGIMGMLGKLGLG